MDIYPKVGGIYKHYKGGSYKVITLAIHTETGDYHVIYKSIEIGCVYSRPLYMFFEVVENTDGRRVERFEFIK